MSAEVNAGVSAEASGEFGAWLGRFFASYYRHRPVNATFIGEHDYDPRLPDFSPEGVAAAMADAETLLREAGQIDVGALGPVERIDKRLAEGFLRIQQWEFGSEHFQRGNPALYTGEAIFGAIGLFLTDYAPFAERAEAACARMHAIEGLLAQGRENVRRAPVAWTQRALRECAGARAFFGAGIDSLAAEEPTAGAALKAELRRAGDAALAAFARHERYLQDELSAAPIGAGLRPRGAGSAAARGALSAADGGRDPGVCAPEDGGGRGVSGCARP